MMFWLDRAPTDPDWDDPWNILRGNGTLDYLKLTPTGNGTEDGSFEWVSDVSVAKQNAYDYFPNGEGIDVRDDELFFISKTLKRMFILNLDSETYTVQATRQREACSMVNRIKYSKLLHRKRRCSILLKTGATMQGKASMDFFLHYISCHFLTFYCFPLCSVHGRNNQGQYFTILESHTYSDETTGLAFSPDGKHLYIAYQANGLLFCVTREDGLGFNAQVLNVKYHNT